jgi:hypothetical protein
MFSDITVTGRSLTSSTSGEIEEEVEDEEEEADVQDVEEEDEEEEEEEEGAIRDRSNDETFCPVMTSICPEIHFKTAGACLD